MCEPFLARSWRIVVGVPGHQSGHGIWQCHRKLIAIDAAMKEFDQYPCFGFGRRMLFRIEDVRHRPAVFEKSAIRASAVASHGLVIFEGLGNESGVRGAKFQPTSVRLPRALRSCWRSRATHCTTLSASRRARATASSSAAGMACHVEARCCDGAAALSRTCHSEFPWSACRRRSTYEWPCLP